MIVDGDRESLRRLERVVSELGLPSESVADGAGAIEVLQRRRFDLMVIDIRLPDIDGMSVLRWTSDNHPFTATIVLTAEISPSSAVDATRLSVSDVLSKPIAAEHMRYSLRRVLAAHRPDSHGPCEHAPTDRRNAIGDRRFEVAALHVFGGLVRGADPATMYELLGQLYHLNGDDEEARRCFEESLWYDPSYARARSGLRLLSAASPDR